MFQEIIVNSRKMSVAINMWVMLLGFDCFVSNSSLQHIMLKQNKLGGY